MNALMRIRINGPDIDRFNALPLAKLWLLEGHILTDSKQVPFPKRYAKDQELDEAAEFLTEFENDGKEFLKKATYFSICDRFYNS